VYSYKHLEARGDNNMVKWLLPFVLMATAHASSLFPSPSGLCHGTITSGSNVLTLADCTFPHPMNNYVAHLGDINNGEMNVTLSFLTPTTAQMNQSATWTGSEIVYFGPDNCQAANQYFGQLTKTGAKGIIGNGYYLSSCPIIVPTPATYGSPFNLYGATMHGTVFVDATPTPHPDFVELGTAGGGIQVELYDMTFIGNRNVTRGTLTAHGPGNGVMTNIAIPESGAAAFWTDSGVGFTITNFVSVPSLNEIAQPVNCISINGNGPMVFVSAVCEGFSGYDAVISGSVEFVAGQMDLSHTGIFKINQGSYVTFTGLDLCEIWTCTEANSIYGFFHVYGGGMGPVHVYPGGVYSLSDADTDYVQADPGAQVTLKNVRGDLSGMLNDQAGIWIDGPVMSKMASSANHQQPITDGPSIQHPWISFPGALAGQDLGGFLSFLAPCMQFGTSTCYINVLSYTQFPMSQTWQVTFNAPWAGVSCSASNPTFVINGKTVTCIQSPSKFSNGNGQTIYPGEIVAYVTDGAGGWVNFSGGTWRVTP
jgi:hypothetical protein